MKVKDDDLFIRVLSVRSRATRVALVLGAFLGVAIVGCGSPGSGGDDNGVSAADGALRGELAMYIADDLEGASQTTYALRAASGAERPLIFEQGAEDLTPGTLIKVWGTDTADGGLRVTSYQRIAPSALEPVRSALIDGSGYTPRSFSFVLVDLGGGFNPAIDATKVNGVMLGNTDSIRNYYINDSYGRQDITAKVVGPLTYTLNGCATNGNTSGPGQLANDLRAMVDAANGGVTSQHYLWYFGTNQSVCMWAGLASIGTPDKPSRDTWYNASTSCVVLVQEPGHNFGMQHSSSLACPGASFADDPNTCTASEYGDIFDPMGGGCRHMNAWQKTYQGWFGGCNGVAVTQSGTFTLLPFENRCDGAQFLKVKAAKSRTFMRPAAGGGGATTETLAYYYVELRTPVDFDGTLGNRSAMTPQILIHAGDDVHTRTQKGVHTFLLDMTPATTGRTQFNDAALPVGSTFTDPAGGVSITATAVSATQATITVDITGGTGAPTCLDGTEFTSPGPGPESCGPGSGSMGNGGATGAGTGGATAGSGGATAGSGGATGSGGRGGTSGGTGGRAGTGTGGRGGTGGTTSPGSGGATSAGSGGTTSAGSGGTTSAGSGGKTAGSGGTTAAGSGGATSAGSGGATAAGSGGAMSAGSGGAAPPAEHSTVEGGCSCAIGADRAAWPASALSLFGVVIAGAARRRRRRR